MVRRGRIHVDAERSVGGPLAVSLCGQLNVPCVDPLQREQATCRVCLKLLERGRRSEPRELQHAMPAHEFAEHMHIALLAAVPHLLPTAPPPPRLSAAEWALSCKGAPTGHRCGRCPLCTWESEAERWAAVKPWNEHVAQPATNRAARWPNIHAAIGALQRYEAEGRIMRSASGAHLARLRLKLGRPGTPAGIRPHGADDVIHVEMAIRRAYAGGFAGLSVSDCARCLLERTGTFAQRTPVPELATRYGVSQPTIAKVVSHGRARVSEDLRARGLLGGRERSAPPPVATTWHAEVFA